MVLQVPRIYQEIIEFLLRAHYGSIVRIYFLVLFLVDVISVRGTVGSRIDQGLMGARAFVNQIFGVYMRKTALSLLKGQIG